MKCKMLMMKLIACVGMFVCASACAETWHPPKFRFYSQTEIGGEYKLIDTVDLYLAYLVDTLPNVQKVFFAGVPNPPDIPGCEFLGWYADSEMSSQNVFSYFKNVPVKRGDDIPSDLLVEFDTKFWTESMFYSTAAYAADFYAKWKVVGKQTIRFNANNDWFDSGRLLAKSVYPDAVGTMGDQQCAIGQDVVLTGCQFSREGFTFKGWATAANFPVAYANGGLVQARDFPKDGGALELYAVWESKTVTISFNYMGWPSASPNVRSETHKVGYQLGLNPMAWGDARVVDGWFTQPSGGEEVLSTTYVPIRDTTYYLHWRNKRCTIKFKANGGEGTMDDLPFEMGVGQRLSPNKFVRPGYVFRGWARSADGEVVYEDGQKVQLPSAIDGDVVTLYAKWADTGAECEIRYHAENGTAGVVVQYFIRGDEVTLFNNLFSNSGFSFAGWATNALGEVVYADRATVADIAPLTDGVVDLYAVWVERVAPVTPVTPSGAALATTYDGYLYRKADGVVVGTVQVKAAKAKDGKSKLTVTVQLAGETKKLSAKGDYDLGLAEEQTFAVAQRGDVRLLLGENGMAGSFEGNLITGVSNVFAANDAASKAAAAAADAAYVGTYNLVANEGSFTVTVAKKGKVKVSCTTSTGKKASASAQLIVSGNAACVPVIAPQAGLAFSVWFGEKPEVDGLTNAAIGKAGTLPTGSVFALDANALAALVGDATYAGYFPSGIAVAQNGSKWAVAGGAKAGKVALTKDKSGVDETKLGANPSGLKLTYTAKTGAFKGAFKAYVNSKGKPKAVTVNVAGVMVGDRGYGTATVKKAGSVPVTVGLAD